MDTGSKTQQDSDSKDVVKVDGERERIEYQDKSGEDSHQHRSPNTRSPSTHPGGLAALGSGDVTF